MEGPLEVHWNGGDVDLTAASLPARIEFGFYVATDIIFPITSVHGEGAVISRKLLLLAMGQSCLLCQ